MTFPEKRGIIEKNGFWKVGKRMLKYTLAREGNFYKGNLHTHSTVSDGEQTPEELKALYKENGYSFLAITDHNRYGIYPELCDEDFLVIPGTEIDCWFGPDQPVDHVVGIGHPEKNTFLRGEKIIGLKQTSAQTLIDHLRAHGNEAIYAHPFWSYTPPELLFSLKGLLGMEIINYSCEQEWKSGISEAYYEHAWNRGHNLWCFGSDDAHGHVPDYCGGYITVKCASLSYDDLFDALHRGSFTASYARYGEEAPKLLDFVVEDGVAKVWCSECDKVCIIADRSHYRPTHAKNEEKVTYAEYVLPEGAVSVKAICVDERRNMTWSQPILL